MPAIVTAFVPRVASAVLAALAAASIACALPPHDAEADTATGRMTPADSAAPALADPGDVSPRRTQ